MSGVQLVPLRRFILRTAGEALALVSRVSGQLAAPLLFRAHWGFGTPEWFDTRLSLLYPQKWFTDGSHVSRANVIGVLPLGGSLLDLCGGDGFTAYYAYSRRARRVVSVDYNESAHRHARRHHSKHNVEHVLADVLTYEPPEQHDVVVIRGAIEHFTEAEQLRIFRLAWRALKPGGWFCGDTPLNAAGAGQLLEHHHNEWQSEQDGRRLLLSVFPRVDTNVFQSGEAVAHNPSGGPNFSHTRTTLLWRCQKITS